MECFKNTFMDYRGKTLRFNDLFRVKRTRERVSGMVTVVEVTVTHMPFCAAFKGKGGRFVGVTRCREPDHWDKELGLRLAERKAMVRAYAFIASVLKDNERLMRGYMESCACLRDMALRRRENALRAFRREGGVP